MIWQKIKSFINRHILDFVLFLSLFFSLYSVCRSSINSLRIDEVSAQVVQIQSDISFMNESLIKRLDVMQSQMDFIMKYSEANYIYFYGDVDGRVNSNNKNVNRTKR